MRDTLSFSVPGNSKIHKLNPGITLIRFIGFDLSFFREQCESLYVQELKKEKDFLTEARTVKEYIRNCHPYCAALLNTTFDKTALDCVIESICLKTGAGPEELWVTYMADRSPFGKAIFERITEYKMGSAINQWTNLRRMQEYAEMKLSVIYGGDETGFAVHRARKLYFDTAFKMTASRLGFGYDDLPAATVASVPCLRISEAVMGSTANLLEPVIRDLTREASAREPQKGKACLHDRAAGEVSDVLKGFGRPGVDELRQVMQVYRTLPDMVFEPDGLKSIIDLEFECLQDIGSYIRVCRDGYSLEKYGSESDGIFIETAAEASDGTEAPAEPPVGSTEMPDEPPDGDMQAHDAPAEQPDEVSIETEPSDDGAVMSGEPETADETFADAPDLTEPAEPAETAEETSPAEPETAAPELEPIPGDPVPDDTEPDDAEPDGEDTDDPAPDDAEPDDTDMDDPALDDAEPDDTDIDDPAPDDAEPDDTDMDDFVLEDVELNHTDENSYSDPVDTAPDGTAPDDTDPDDDDIEDDMDEYFAGSDEADSDELTILTARVKEIIRLTDLIKNRQIKIETPQEFHMRCLQLWTNMKTDSNSNVTPDEAFEWLRYSIRVRYAIEKGLLPADTLGRFLAATCQVFRLTARDR